MAQQSDDFFRRPLYIYDLPNQVLGTLVFKSDDETATISDESQSITNATTAHGVSAETKDTIGSQACALCSLVFSSLLDQKGHLKSDLHHYNLKQKLRGQKSVSEIEFEKLLGNLDESLSGSDDDESEDDEDSGTQESTLTALLKKQAKISDKMASNNHDQESSQGVGKSRSTMLWFSSPLLPPKHYFGLYRAILNTEEQSQSDFVTVLRDKQIEPVSIPRPNKDGTLPEIAYRGPHIFLCMIGGGHFAAMVVSLAPRQQKGATAMNREATVLAHKTFHRYTTRRKQGGSQSANDNAKGTAHSAGSSLRRYNEQALVQDIRTVLQAWKGLIDTSELLFIRATGTTNRRTLFGPYDDQVLRNNDPRLRGFPFSTRRATQKELMRCFIELTRFKIREIEPQEETTKKASEEQPKPSTQKSSKPKPTEEDETAMLHTSQIQALIRRSKLPALLSYLKINNLSPNFEFQPSAQNHHAPMPLHFAAAQNSAPVVLGLLTRASASPLLKNSDGKTPFELCGDRSTRDAFRVARSELGEDKWDWESAHVPTALTKAEVDRRDQREKQDAGQKEAERRKTEEERLRLEGPKVVDSTSRKVKANTLTAALAKTPQERREEEIRGLTPEMRMRLERERRARAAEERLRKMKSGN